MSLTAAQLTQTLINSIDSELAFSAQMRVLRQVLNANFGEKSTALWAYLEDSQPLAQTPFALGIGFETPEVVNQWLSAHPYPWQAIIEVLRYPVQTWSRDRKFAHTTLTSILHKGAPSDAAENAAMLECIYLLLEDPVWRPGSLRSMTEMLQSNPKIFWQIPTLTGLNFAKYKTSPLMLMLAHNMSFGANADLSPTHLNQLQLYWRELGLGCASPADSTLPAEFAYAILSEALYWTDKNWCAVTGVTRTADTTWALVDRLSPPRLSVWRDLLEGDENPHLLLAPYIKSSLKRTPVNANLKEIEGALSELEFTLTSF